MLTLLRLLMHDPEVYTDPYTFKPERFLGDNPERDPDKVTFGFGRRVCPGRFMAATGVSTRATRSQQCEVLTGSISQVFVTAASILHTFNITKPLNEKGEPVEPRVEYYPGLIRSVLC